MAGVSGKAEEFDGFGDFLFGGVHRALGRFVRNTGAQGVLETEPGAIAGDGLNDSSDVMRRVQAGTELIARSPIRWGFKLVETSGASLDP